MKNSIFFIIVIVLFFSCKKDDPVITPSVRVYQDVIDDFNLLDTSPGIHDVALLFNNGKLWNFRIIAPNQVEGAVYPLVFDLHGASGGAADAHMHSDCYLESAFEGHDVFFIIPNGGIDQWNSIGNQEMVINLLILAKNNWPVDGNKVAVTGYSNGGNGSWFFGETQPDLFSAALPMASSYSTILPNGDVRTMPIPMYCIHGEFDDLFPLVQTQEWVNATIDAGSDVTFVVAPGLGHYMPCDYDPYLKDGVNWLFITVWN